MKAREVKATTKFTWFVIVKYDGISNYEYREVGDVVSRHHTYTMAERSARRSDKWQIAHVGDITA